MHINVTEYLSAFCQNIRSSIVHSLSLITVYYFICSAYSKIDCIYFCSTHYFQASLSETEKIAEAAEQQLRSTLREILIVEAEMENLLRGANTLRGRCASISVENTQLGVNIREQEAEAEAVLEKFTAYRNKMQAHRTAVELASSQTHEHKALEESRALVRRLTQQRDELREDLDNPKGNTVQREKVEKGEKKTTCQGANLY